jgi:hypothetical protein
MTNERTSGGNTTRPNDWTGDEWAGDEERRQGGPMPDDTEQTAADTDRWNKTQWVGDQGDGAPARIDPDAMPEGDNDLSGFRHTPGEEHWAEGQATGGTGSRTGADREIDAG